MFIMLCFSIALIEKMRMVFGEIDPQHQVLTFLQIIGVCAKKPCGDTLVYRLLQDI